MHIEDGNGGDRQASSFAHGLNATLGLVIHGAADGIALGASSLSGNGSLGLVVFLAVLVHKGKLMESMRNPLTCQAQLLLVSLPL
jgi:zinc transporter 9